MINIETNKRLNNYKIKKAGSEQTQDPLLDDSNSGVWSKEFLLNLSALELNFKSYSYLFQ